MIDENLERLRNATFLGCLIIVVSLATEQLLLNKLLVAAACFLNAAVDWHLTSKEGESSGFVLQGSALVNGAAIFFTTTGWLVVFGVVLHLVADYLEHGKVYQVLSAPIASISTRVEGDAAQEVAQGVIGTLKKRQVILFGILLLMVGINMGFVTLPVGVETLWVNIAGWIFIAAWMLLLEGGCLRWLFFFMAVAGVFVNIGFGLMGSTTSMLRMSMDPSGLNKIAWFVILAIKLVGSLNLIEVVEDEAKEKKKNGSNTEQ